MELFKRYKELNIDGSSISLESVENVYPYFCYPTNAIPIGLEGCILYCFLPEYENMVFAVNPESCADKNIYPVASSFEDFIKLILTCGSASPVEQIVWMSKEQFEQHLQKESEIQTTQQKELLILLKQEFNLVPMESPFEYVKAIQKEFDDGKVQYSDEYYDVLGIER